MKKVGILHNKDLLFKGNRTLQVAFFVMLFTCLWSNLSIYVIVIFTVLAIPILPIKNYVDKTAICLGLFSVFYCLPMLYWGITSLFNFVSYLLCPFVFYIYGKYVAAKLSPWDTLSSFIGIGILLFSGVLYISVMQDIKQNGFVNVMRALPIWGMDVENDSLSATLYGIVASLGFVGLPIFLVKTEVKQSMKLLYLLLFVLSLVSVVHLVNRTGLVVTLACFICVSVYSFRGRKSYTLLVGGLVLILTIIVIYPYLISPDVFEAYSNRNQGIGEINTAGGRMGKCGVVLQNIFRFPFGWDVEEPQYGYAHNLWIDIARVSGIIPFVFFLIVTFMSYYKLLKMLMLKDMAITPLILGLHICFFLSLFVEPVIEALPLYFYLYLMLWGIQNEVYVLLRRKMI